MRPRFVGRVGIADVATIGNIVVGFLAVLVAPRDTALAARLLLLAAIADGLDGVLARRYGGTPIGETLDSLADVVSFGVAPAVLVVAVARSAWGPFPASRTALALVVATAFVAMAVVRLALYTVEEAGTHQTIGVPTTLAATILAATVLAGVGRPAVVVAAGAVFSYLMVTRVTYTDLADDHAVGMGVVQALAVLVPTAFARAFPRLLLAAAVLYLVLGPWYYGPDAA
jgi:CDP-diacylglycerol--serine O-phosphatidyltransferase